MSWIHYTNSASFQSNCNSFFFKTEYLSPDIKYISNTILQLLLLVLNSSNIE